jgi:hypothetical protein
MMDIGLKYNGENSVGTLGVKLPVGSITKKCAMESDVNT